jgi:hypothetical protein
LQAKEIKDKLKSLINEASSIDPSLERRLVEVNRWVKDVKPGSLTSKRFVVAFLLQIIRDAEAWLRLKSLISEQEQQFALDQLKPTVKYWYGYLFLQWLNKNDPKFHIWRQKLMAGEFNQKDARVIESLTKIIRRRQGTVVQRYIADLSMATDIIISNRQNQPLCLQLTTISEQFSQAKSKDWENTLRFWEIERGLFLSFNPRTDDFENQLVNIALYNSDNLKKKTYLRFSL